LQERGLLINPKRKIDFYEMSMLMQILVDADACPVKQIIVRLAKEHNIPVTMLTDTSHEINDGYSYL
jgi:hypothetical protein